MRSPYQTRPARTFWRTGVAEAGDDIPDLYRKKFTIDCETRIATAGSCFAQHIGRALTARGFTVLDAEPAPGALDHAVARSFGYGLFSARYANIYTIRQLVQLVREARGRFQPADPVWERDGRYFDSQRPSVEPNGLSSAALVRQHRTCHLEAVRRLFREAEVLVLTLGLTETWKHRRTGTVYPTAPGTIAGNFDPDVHVFENLDYNAVREDFLKLREILQKPNPGLRFLLTVSPVPLTATATDDHVLAATTYSKSVLRAVAGSLREEFADVDYFPSYEIITGPQARGRYFGDNLRSIEEAGVAAVMREFFAEHDPDGVATVEPAPPRVVSGDAADDVACEDALLDGFAR